MVSRFRPLSGKRKYTFLVAKMSGDASSAGFADNSDAVRSSRFWGAARIRRGPWRKERANDCAAPPQSRRFSITPRLKRSPRVMRSERDNAHWAHWVASGGYGAKKTDLLLSGKRAWRGALAAG